MEGVYRQSQPEILVEVCTCGHPKNRHYWFNSEYVGCLAEDNGEVPVLGRCNCEEWEATVAPETNRAGNN